MSNSNQLKVSHNADDFLEGHEMILTLKDTLLLDGEDIFEGDDILENAELKTKEKVNAILKIQESMKKGYRQFQDENEEPGSKTLLPHYDTPSFEKVQFSLNKNGFYIGHNSSETKVQTEAQLESIKEKLKINKGVSLSVNKKIQGEFMSKKEAGFLKKKSKKGNKDAMKDLVDFLQENVEEEKEELQNMGTKEVLETNKNSYNLALEKAKTKTIESQKRNSSFAFANEDIDEDNELERALERERRQKIKKVKVEDAVNDLLMKGEKLKIVEQQNPEFILGNNEESAINEFSESFDNKQEFKLLENSSDFLRNIQVQPENLKKIPTGIYSMKDSARGTASIVNITLPSERMISFSQTQDDVNFKKPLSNENSNSDIGSEELNFMDEEAVDNSTAATLSRMRALGVLQPTEDDISGRTKDKKEFLKNHKEINLEYRDENGRLMTQKEAFRYMCWIFHNKRPSKNKMEKKLKKQKEQEQRKRNEGKLMKALHKEQESSNKPYMQL